MHLLAQAGKLPTGWSGVGFYGRGHRFQRTSGRNEQPDLLKYPGEWVYFLLNYDPRATFDRDLGCQGIVGVWPSNMAKRTIEENLHSMGNKRPLCRSIEGGSAWVAVPMPLNNSEVSHPGHAGGC